MSILDFYVCVQIYNNSNKNKKKEKNYQSFFNSSLQQRLRECRRNVGEFFPVFLDIFVMVARERLLVWLGTREYMM